MIARLRINQLTAIPPGDALAVVLTSVCSSSPNTRHEPTMADVRANISWQGCARRWSHTAGDAQLWSTNIEFSCRPESADHATVRRTAFLLNRLHPGGQLQRFVMAAFRLIHLICMRIPALTCSSISFAILSILKLNLVGKSCFNAYTRTNYCSVC